MLRPIPSPRGFVQPLTYQIHSVNAASLNYIYSRREMTIWARAILEEIKPLMDELSAECIVGLQIILWQICVVSSKKFFVEETY